MNELVELSQKSRPERCGLQYFRTFGGLLVVFFFFVNKVRELQFVDLS